MYSINSVKKKRRLLLLKDFLIINSQSQLKKERKKLSANPKQKKLLKQHHYPQKLDMSSSHIYFSKYNISLSSQLIKSQGIDIRGFRIQKGKRLVPRKKKVSRIKKLILKERLNRQTETNLKELSVKKLNKGLNTSTTQMDEKNSKDDEINSYENKKNNFINNLQYNSINQNIINCQQSDTLIPSCSVLRPYINQDISVTLNIKVRQFLLNVLTERQYQQNIQSTIHQLSKQYFVFGLKQCLKHIRMLRCIIIAPNLEPSLTPGGLNDILFNLQNCCNEKQIPMIFALSRNILGRLVLNCIIRKNAATVAWYRVCSQTTRQACVGIKLVSWSSQLEADYKAVIQLATQLRESWKSNKKLYTQC